MRVVIDVDGSIMADIYGGACVILTFQSNVLLGAICMFLNERSVYIKEIQMYNNKVFVRPR